MQSGSMQASKIKFKVGQKWKNRDGDIVSIASIDSAEDYPVIGHDGRGWTEDGFYFREIGRHSRADLVELVVDCSNDNKYSVEEVITALYKISGDSFSSYVQEVKGHLAKAQDPGYQKYLELKAKFE